MFVSPKRRDLYLRKKISEYKKQLKIDCSKADVAELEVQRMEIEEFNHFFVCAEGNHWQKFKKGVQEWKAAKVLYDFTLITAKR